MAFRSVTTFEKPLQHISLTDWNARVDRLRNVSDAHLKDTVTLRNSSRAVCDEIRIDAKWTNQESNEALTDRIAEVQFWKDLLTKTFGRLEVEIGRLQVEKTATERVLDSQAGPLSVLSQMLTMRDSRLGSEITYDEPDKELKNELLVIENNQRLLSDICHKVWEKLTHLDQIRFKASIEIQNKRDVLNLDRTQLALDRNSNTLSNKLDSSHGSKSFCSHEDWILHVKNIKQLIESEIADTSVMRETLFVSRAQARCILKAQQNRTDGILRKRIFETQRAHNELEWQQQKIKREIERAICDIKVLEDELYNMTNNLKLAKTRLENRTQRFDKELCLDHAHQVLLQEVKKLDEMRRCLIAKIDEFRLNINLLSDHAQKIDTDLENKRQSLEIDQRALEIRNHLKDDDTVEVNNPSPQTDYNILITGMENNNLKP